MSPFNTGTADIKHAIGTSDTDAGTTWTVFYVSGVAQGTANLNRSGDKIQSKDITICLRKVDVDNVSVIRGVLFADKHNQGGAPTAAEVFYNDSIETVFEVNNRNRFVIIADFTCPASGHSADLSDSFVKIHRKLGFPIYYTGTLATAANSGPNSVWLALCATQAVDDNEWYSDMTFTDI